MAGILQNGLAQIAHVPGKNDLLLLAALSEPDLDAGRTQEVADVRKAAANPLGHVHHGAVVTGHKQGESPLSVVHVVHGFHRRAPGPLGFAAFPFRVLHLDVGAVPEHDLAQLRGDAGGEDLSLKTVFIEEGDIPRMVDVGVGQQEEVNVPGLYRERLVFIKVAPLLHAVVHQAGHTSHLDKGAAARDLVAGAQKRQFQI